MQSVVDKDTAMSSDRSPSVALGTVLVVGGCGFLGSSVVDQLLNFPSEDTTTSDAAGPKTRPPTSSINSPQTAVDLTFPSLSSRYPSYRDTTVHVLDIRCNRNRYPGATYHEADITSPSAILPIFQTVQPVVVIHTASPMYDAPKPVLRKVNVDGTRTLLEVAGGVHGSYGTPCKVFIYTSSAAVIHDVLTDLVSADERWPYVDPNPSEYYPETKVHGERLVLAANRLPKFNNMVTCAIRPAGIVGENDHSGITYGLLETARVAPDWQLHFQMGTGDNLFDTTYVGNVVYAHLLVARHLLLTHKNIAAGNAPPPDHEKIDGEAFMVTNDSPVYFWDTSRYIWTLYGWGVLLK